MKNQSYWIGAALVFVVVAHPVVGRAQSKAQEKCINAMNDKSADVANAQGDENVGCIEAAKAGVLLDTVDDCVIADAPGVANAKQDTIDTEAKKCSTPLPSFGFTGATTTNAAAKAEEIALLHSIFGTPADPAFPPGNDSCQAAATKAIQKIVDASLKEFLACKKRGLKSDTITGSGGLAACVGLDPKGKVSKAVQNLGRTLDKYCITAAELYSKFPGCVVATPEDLRLCMSTAAKCRACTIAKKVDGFSALCDTLDDGNANGTCPQCGNGVTDPGEECDDAGESAACDSDCTFAVCGDRVLNVTALEQCDDGNTSNGDCCDSVCLFEPPGSPCNDGIICTIPDECNGAGSCAGVAAPATYCAAPQSGGASLKLKEHGAKDKLMWKWGKGAADLTDYGAPQSHGFTLCVYNQSAPLATPTFFGSFRLRADSSLWKELPNNKGFKYKDRALYPNGVSKGQVKPGLGTKAKIKVKAKGSRLGFSPFSLNGLTVQLRRSSPDPDPGLAPCFSSSFFTDFKRNDSEQFKDKSD